MKSLLFFIMTTEDRFIALMNVTKIYHQGANPVVALDQIT